MSDKNGQAIYYKNKKKEKLQRKKEKMERKLMKKKNKNKGVIRGILTFIKWLLITIFVIMLLAFIAVGVAVWMFYDKYGDDLKIDTDKLIISTENSKIVDKDGNLLAVIAGDEKRQIITLEEMGYYLPKAYIAIEDERFYEHKGVDVKRTAGAIYTYINNKVFKKGDASFGGSTITQQLVKNITEDKDRDGLEGVIRKMKEWARAYNLEKTLSKNQILELYLNMIFVGGPNLHGVELGARYYFNKSANELSLAECAFMAGINSAPATYNAFSEDEAMIEKIKNKTKVVINKMHELGFILSEEDYNYAMNEAENGLVFEQGSIVTYGLSYHTEAAINQVVSDYMAENDCTREFAELYIYSSGLTIYTTQDSEIQRIMEEVYSNEDYIKPSQLHEGAHTESAMVVLDHKTGHVVGVVGGLGEKTAYGLNRATQSTRQTGSSMKPLAAIGPALNSGIITAASVYDDCPTTFGTNYTPKNYYGNYKGLSNIRYVIEISQNIIPMKILRDVGITNAIEFLEQLGITSIVKSGTSPLKNDESLSIAIGGLTRGVSPLEMAGAYGTYANDGVYLRPVFYTEVKDANGNVVLTAKQEPRRVMSEANAYIMKSILTQPVVGYGGTATICKIPRMEVAAKTGTTDNEYDRWVCGFTPYYTTAIWYGYDENEDIPYISRIYDGYKYGGGNPCSYIFRDVMRPIHENLEDASFQVPDNITRAWVCRYSGKLATEECKYDLRGNAVYSEIFVEGTAPKEYCTTHVTEKVCINSDGSYVLATDACPEPYLATFITRPNADTDNSWKRALDAGYMAPTEYCTRHGHSVVEAPKPPSENIGENNSSQSGNNSGDGTDNKPSDNTPGNDNVPGGNSVNNNTPGGNGSNSNTGNTTGNNGSNSNNSSGNNSGGNNNESSNTVDNKKPTFSIE